MSHSSWILTRGIIDSQFNLPSEVVISIDVANTNNSNINAQELVANNNNPQNGALVGQTFMDANLNSTVDKDAVSGYAPSPIPLLPPFLFPRHHWHSAVLSGNFQPARRFVKAPLLVNMHQMAWLCVWRETFEGGWGIESGRPCKSPF